MLETGATSPNCPWEVVQKLAKTCLPQGERQQLKRGQKPSLRKPDACEDSANKIRVNKCRGPLNNQQDAKEAFNEYAREDFLMHGNTRSESPQHAALEAGQVRGQYSTVCKLVALSKARLRKVHFSGDFLGKGLII